MKLLSSSRGRKSSPERTCEVEGGEMRIQRRNLLTNRNSSTQLFVVMQHKNGPKLTHLLCLHLGVYISFRDVTWCNIHVGVQ